MTGLPQAIVALTVGHRPVAKLQALGRRDGCRRCGWHCRARMLSTTSALQAPQSSASAQARLDRLQPVLLNRREDPHELPVTVVATRQPGPYAAERAGQLPALEGRAVPQRTGLPRQDRHVVPRIVGDLAAPEAPGVFGNSLAILADDNPIGIGPHVDRPPDGAGRHAVVVVVRSAPDKSWRPIPRWRGSRRRGRDRPSGRGAPPRTPATPSCPRSSDAAASWRPRYTDPISHSLISA